MSDTSYLEGHAFRRAFLAHHLAQLADQISSQGEAFLEDAGLDFPSRAVSSVLVLGERGPMSTADIAEALNQLHQVVTQRVDLLVSHGLVERVADPKDKRRKLLSLSPKGQVQYAQLREALARADAAFTALDQELECDLIDLISRISKAFNRASVLERTSKIPPADTPPSNDDASAQ